MKLDNVDVTEGEAVRVLIDEWEKSLDSPDSDAALFAAQALLTISSGVCVCVCVCMYVCVCRCGYMCCVCVYV